MGDLSVFVSNRDTQPVCVCSNRDTQPVCVCSDRDTQPVCVCSNRDTQPACVCSNTDTQPVCVSVNVKYPLPPTPWPRPAPRRGNPPGQCHGQTSKSYRELTLARGLGMPLARGMPPVGTGLGQGVGGSGYWGFWDIGPGSMFVSNWDKHTPRPYVSESSNWDKHTPRPYVSESSNWDKHTPRPYVSESSIWDKYTPSPYVLVHLQARSGPPFLPDLDHLNLDPSCQIWTTSDSPRIWDSPRFWDSEVLRISKNLRFSKILRFCELQRFWGSPRIWDSLKFWDSDVQESEILRY